MTVHFSDHKKKKQTASGRSNQKQKHNKLKSPDSELNQQK